MTPLEYLTNVVEPNLADLSAEYGDIRHCLNFVHSVDALAAHIFYASNGAAHGRDDLAYRNALATQHPEFALLRDIAKAVKHVRLIRGSPQTRRGDYMEVRSLGWGEGAWGDGRWGGPPQAVIPVDGGGVRVVETVATNALNVLKSEMAKFGLDQ